MKLTENFALSEFINGTAMPDRAKRLALETINPNIIGNLHTLAIILQSIRNDLSKKYGEVKIIITSGYRAPQWESQQGRNVPNVHSQGLAADFVFISLKNDSQKIMQEFFKEFNEHWNGGLAKKEVEGKIRFIHIDIRGKRARWEY